ncbi:MAG TPA: hypothetical protein P5511_03505 [Candidatus Goldiibacteriota bacterium]|nr:hypothetical protein [Candidatus Goldiibacteriota bacterium]
MAKVRNAGILSLTIKRTGPATPANDAVLKQAADYAFSQLEARLKESAPFKVVPASALYKIPEYAYAGTVAKATGAMAFLKNNPDALEQGKKQTESSGDFMTALKEGLKAEAESAAAKQDPAAAAQKILDGYKTDYVGASGLPFIPYGIINNVMPGEAVTYVNGVRQGGANEGIKQMMIEQAKAVCAKTKLDAVIIAHAEALAEPPKGVRVIVGDRVVGTLKVDMTMLMIDKNGEIIADFDWPVMDDLAPMKLARPTHKAVTWRMSGGKNWPDKIEIDLADTNGEILRDLKELSAEAAKRLAEKLKNEMNKE